MTSKSATKRLKAILILPLAGLFIGSGILHFTDSAPYLRLMPPMLPAPLQLVYISGAIEAGLGAMLLFPRTRCWAAWALIPTLLAVFPANISGATSAGTVHPAMPGIPIWVAWARLPLQFVLIAWSYWYTKQG